MKKIEVIYSPLYISVADLLENLSIWLCKYNVEISSVAYNNFSIAQGKLLKENNIIDDERIFKSCLFSVFYNGRLIDSVPLNKDNIYKALGIDKLSEDNLLAEASVTVEQRYERIINHIEWIPITKETLNEEATICLCDDRYINHASTIYSKYYDIKLRVMKKVCECEKCAGIYARLGDKVIGVLEIIPREIARKHGLTTGTIGNDTDYLTVGCYEVACGMPCLDLLDGLMKNLEGLYSLFTRKYIEGVGVFEMPESNTPYWIYDKYGFKRVEIINDKKVVMIKKIK